MKGTAEWKSFCEKLLVAPGWSHIRDYHRSSLSDKALIARINEGKNRASRFIMDDFDDLIVDTLVKEQPWLEAWINDKSDFETYVVAQTFDNIIGEGYVRYKWHDWKQGPIKTKDLEIVLAKDTDKYGGTIVKIVSAYPLIVK